MELDFVGTPPKKTKRQEADAFSTPPIKTSPINCYETPRKSSTKKKLEMSPEFKYSTPPKGENPQSKKQKLKSKFGSNGMKTPGSSNRKRITQFNISRLDQDYSFVRALGQGNFSRVGLYKSHMTGELFAIKVTKLSSMSINQAQALGTLSIFSHQSKNIVRYFHSWVQNNELYLVMEFCSHTLTSVFNEHRQNKEQIKQSHIKQILKQSLQGLKCMHQNGMVHLDLKPDNMLFSHSKYEKNFLLKISDLGLTRITQIKRQSELEEGDSRYLAKQILNYHSGVDLTKSDIFSLGMTIYQGLTLQILPNNGEQWVQTREQGLHLTSRMDLTEYSRQLLQIVELMTQPDWNNRPSAQNILKMRYFKESLSKRPKLLEGNHKKGGEQRKKDSSV